MDNPKCESTRVDTSRGVSGAWNDCFSGTRGQRDPQSTKDISLLAWLFWEISFPLPEPLGGQKRLFDLCAARPSSLPNRQVQPVAKYDRNGCAEKLVLHLQIQLQRVLQISYHPVLCL